jgi:hypothetical protein
LLISGTWFPVRIPSPKLILMRALLLVICIFLTFVANGQTVVRPKRDSSLRKTILSALREPVAKDIGQKVKFSVDHLNVADDWAFMSGRALTLSGKPVDYRKTKYRSNVEAGAFDDWICALLRRRDGKWRVVQFAIGSTDVVWDGWDKLHKAPRAIFPYPSTVD